MGAMATPTLDEDGLAAGVRALVRAYMAGER